MGIDDRKSAAAWLGASNESGQPCQAAQGIELSRSELTMDLVWKIGAGYAFSIFAEALKEQRILGQRCPSCGLVCLPPRPLCGDCLARLHEWIEVGPQGTVETITIVHHAITDPVTGQARSVPYAMALIRLDGASTTLNHFLVGDDPRHGMRVKPVWRDESTGTMADIAGFEEVP